MRKMNKINKAWNKITVGIGVFTMLGVLYGVFLMWQPILAAAEDVPQLKQSVQKLTTIVDKLAGRNKDLYDHLRGVGYSEDQSTAWSRHPIGQQFDTTGTLLLYEPRLDADSLLIRGLLVMDVNHEGGVDTLKELYRIEIKK
jgi:hypothetical protein